MNINQSEVWGDAKRQGTELVFQPSTVDLPALKNLAQGYQRYKINNITIEYEPAVGTTVDGIIHWGIVPGDFTGPPTEAKAKACFPRQSGPVWRRSVIRFSHDIVMTQPWFVTTTPAFSLIAWCSTTDKNVVGVFEARYSVTLDLPQAI